MGGECSRPGGRGRARGVEWGSGGVRHGWAPVLVVCTVVYIELCSIDSGQKLEKILAGRGHVGRIEERGVIGVWEARVAKSW